MTTHELASRLHGKERGHETDGEEENIYNKSGMVVAYGHGDDMLIFEGGINLSVSGCKYKEQHVYLFNGKEVNQYRLSRCLGCNLLDDAADKAKYVQANWHDHNNPRWTFATDIPHATFGIYDNGKLFSEGIVFDVQDTMEFPNKPLTLNELKKMAGMPVWVQMAKGGWYDVIRMSDDNSTVLLSGSTPPNSKYGHYWIAYRRKPEEGAK